VCSPRCRSRSSTRSRRGCRSPPCRRPPADRSPRHRRRHPRATSFEPPDDTHTLEVPDATAEMRTLFPVTSARRACASASAPAVPTRRRDRGRRNGTSARTPSR
jgi:hypothetical protein